jgi:hypothetical protein
MHCTVLEPLRSGSIQSSDHGNALPVKLGVNGKHWYWEPSPLNLGVRLPSIMTRTSPSSSLPLCVRGTFD